MNFDCMLFGMLNAGDSPSAVMFLATLTSASMVNRPMQHRSPYLRMSDRLMQRRSPCPHMSGAAGTAAGGGGDLSGGGDDERNEQLDQLRKMFEAPAAEVEASSEAEKIEEAKRLGLLLDLPLCRYSWCLLPHHQIAMSVWQPQYTLMFSKLLAQPPPHYYFHVLLPGGAESLGQPGHELEPGTKSSLVGTLVRIAYARRNPDQTLTLVVQGLCRGVVLKATQYLPYSRGDVQVVPDSEALLAGARSAEARLARQGASDDTQSMKRRMVAAAASMEASAWLAYEAVQLSIDAGGALAQLNQLNASALAACAEAAPVEVDLALRRVPTWPPVASAPPPSDTEDRGVQQAATTDAEADEEAVLYQGSVVFDWLQAAVEAAETEAREAREAGGREAAESLEALLEAAEDDAALELLEVQVWLELDALLAALGRRASAAAAPQPQVPPQLLGLLPPPPSTGWPSEFQLAAVAAKLAADYEPPEQGAEAEGVVPISYVPIDPLYPARKRVERLSWMVWTVIGDQKVGVNSFGGSPYQELLEAEGTAERLRLARRKIQTYMERLRE